MRRFEFIEGSSNKFWEIDIDGSTLRIRYGKIGSSGQEQEKSFPNNEKTAKEYAKLIHEKTNKGYKEIEPVASTTESAASITEVEESSPVAEVVVLSPSKPAVVVVNSSENILSSLAVILI